MSDIPVRIKKLSKEACIPEYQKLGDSGCDLVSIEDVSMPVGSIRLVRTGIAVQIGKGIEGQIRPRSGFAIKYGITVVNSPGTIDSNYRGEIKVGLINLGPKYMVINKGDRIAQLVFSPVYKANFIEAEELDYTERGADGFGSTGFGADTKL